jgi:hypothetical protein
MRVRRTLAALCVTAPLALAATACSDTSGGSVTGSNHGVLTDRIANPVHGKCHTFAGPGVDAVTNTTGVDIRLHQSPDCTDPGTTPSFYLATTLSATSTIGQPPWRSFTIVGWPPPVSVS